jgi:hypothetical protein
VIAEAHRGGRAILAVSTLRLARLPGLPRRLALTALATFWTLTTLRALARRPLGRGPR